VRPRQRQQPSEHAAHVGVVLDRSTVDGFERLPAAALVVVEQFVVTKLMLQPTEARPAARAQAVLDVSR
jgi:hypothetical protein